MAEEEAKVLSKCNREEVTWQPLVAQGGEWGFNHIMAVIDSLGNGNG